MSETQTPVDEDFMRKFKDMQRKLDDISNASVSGSQFATGDLIPSFSATRAGAVLADGTTYLDTDPLIGTTLAAMLRAIPACVVDATHVKVPDARGCVIGGVGGSLPTLATIVGVASVTLTAAESGSPAHTHPGGTTGAGSAHNHGPGAGAQFVNVTAGATAVYNAAAGALAVAQSLTTGNEAAHTHSTPTVAASSATAASAAHTNLQPTLPANIFIKT